METSLTEADPHLPYDLIATTIDYLRHDNASLLACCLVAKEWVYPTRRHLFTKLRVRARAEDIGRCRAGGEGASEEEESWLGPFLTFLGRNPQVASIVRHVELHGVNDPASKVYAPICHHVLARAVSYLRALRSLSLVKLDLQCQCHPRTPPHLPTSLNDTDRISYDSRPLLDLLHIGDFICASPQASNGTTKVITPAGEELAHIMALFSEIRRLRLPERYGFGNANAPLLLSQSSSGEDAPDTGPLLPVIHEVEMAYGYTVTAVLKALGGGIRHLVLYKVAVLVSALLDQSYLFLFPGAIGDSGYGPIIAEHCPVLEHLTICTQHWGPDLSGVCWACVTEIIEEAPHMISSLRIVCSRPASQATCSPSIFAPQHIGAPEEQPVRPVRMSSSWRGLDMLLDCRDTLREVVFEMMCEGSKGWPTGVDELIQRGLPLVSRRGLLRVETIPINA